jgi:hypothetical protein
MGSSKQTTTTDQGPWKVQQPYIEGAFKEAQSLYDSNKNTPGYTGDFVAGLTDQQRGLIDSGVNYYNSTGANLGQNTANLSQGALSTGTTGVNQSAGALTNIANTDPTGANIAAAGRYANNPFISGMVDNAMLDARRQVSEGVIPNLYRGAAATGNLNSDRTALAQGVVERGLAEKAAGISAELAGNSWGRGLELADSARNQSIDALTRAGALYGDLSATGLSGTELGSGISDNAIQNALSLSTLYQQNNQDMLNNAMQKQQYAQDRPYDMLQRYYDLVGGNNWGSYGTTTTKTQASPAQTASMIIGSIGSLMKGASGFA